jgi:hypothetical protein
LKVYLTMFGYDVTNLKIFISKNDFSWKKCDKCVVNWNFDKQAHSHGRSQAYLDEQCFKLH